PRVDCSLSGHRLAAVLSGLQKLAALLCGGGNHSLRRLSARGSALSLGLLYSSQYPGIFPHFSGGVPLSHLVFPPTPAAVGPGAQPTTARAAEGLWDGVITYLPPKKPTLSQGGLWTVLPFQKFF